MKILAGSCALPLLAAVASAQATLVVPSTFPTIQSAIVAATNGDTVLVLPGTYVERIDFLGKAITVRGAAGAATTTIDGNQGGTVVTFATNEPPTAVLEGFTITNGLGASVGTGATARSEPGGVRCAGASPTIRACVIRGNTGGAGWTPVAAGQFAGSGGAGGLAATASALQLVDCEIRDNTGGQGGTGTFGFGGGRGGAGGAYFSFTQAGVPPLVRCRFVANHGGDGGGLAPTVPGTGGRGGDGGIEQFATVGVQWTLCEVRGNRGGDGAAGGLGGNGGFDASAPSALAVVQLGIAGCAVVGNTGGNGPGAWGGDGGGATGPTRVTVIASTFAGNATGTPQITGTGTGGLAVGGFMISSAALHSCIAWGNTRLGLPSDLYSNGIATQASNSDFGAVTGTVFGNGNLSVDPLFANLATGDVHLTAASPCRHAGGQPSGVPLFDLDGDARVIGPAMDIGADEWDGLTGTREDLVLTLTVNDVVQPAVVTSTAVANDGIALRVRSPGGTLANDCTLLLADGWLPPVPPLGPAGLPELHVSVGAFWLALYPTGVGPQGQVVGATLPPGLTGFALRFQAIALSPAARNRVFAATSARDLIL